MIFGNNDMMDGPFGSSGRRPQGIFRAPAAQGSPNSTDGGPISQFTPQPPISNIRRVNEGAIGTPPPSAGPGLPSRPAPPAPYAYTGPTMSLLSDAQAKADLSRPPLSGGSALNGIFGNGNNLRPQPIFGGGGGFGFGGVPQRPVLM